MTETPNSGIPGELEARVDEIYAADLGSFIEARKALMTEVKASGDRVAAAAIQKLAKPNLVAWAINQLFFREREDFDSLVEAGEVLRQAQQDGDAEELRGAGDARREALATAVEKAADLLSIGGHAAPLQTLQRLERSLETVAAYGHSGQLVPAAGRLIGDLEAPGFEVLATLAMARPTSSKNRQGGGKASARKAGRKKAAGRKPTGKGAVEAAEESAPIRPKLSVVRGGGGKREDSSRDPAKPAPRSVDAGHLRERNRLLRRARELETLVSKSETATVRSQRSLAETERAFDLRKRNLAAAQKSFDESQVELDKRQARLTELQDQHQELSSTLEEVRGELAALDGGGQGE